MSDEISAGPNRQPAQRTDIAPEDRDEDAAQDRSGEDLATPRASHCAQPDGDNDSDGGGGGGGLTMTEDYFSPPFPPQPSAVRRRPSQLLSLQASARSGSPSSPKPGLQSKATVAVSLPEGVYAQQQDGVGSGGSGSITTAPSFSDSISIKSAAPTLSTGDNDVESMLGEILLENDARFGGSFVEELRDDTADDADADQDSDDEDGDGDYDDDEDSDGDDGDDDGDEDGDDDDDGEGKRTTFPPLFEYRIAARAHQKKGKKRSWRAGGRSASTSSSCRRPESPSTRATAARPSRRATSA